MLTLIADYCSHKVCRERPCSEGRPLPMADRCLALEVADGLERDPSCDLDLILRMDRGLLAYPSSFTFPVARYRYFVFSTLTSDATNESLYLNAIVQQVKCCGNQQWRCCKLRAL